MSNKHDLPIAAHAVIMIRGPVLQLAVRDDVADEVACRYRNNGVDCDVVQLVRHSDAIAAIQRLEAENEALRGAIHDEMDEGLRLRELGGAGPDENITAMTERIIRERDALKKDAGPSLTVSADEHGCAVLEWWNGPKKITLYTVGHPQESLLKVWGPDMSTDMAFVSLMDAFAVKEAFGWLADAAMTKEQKP